MSAVMFTLVRHRDPSGVSGTGPIGTVVEFDNGDAVLHWDTDTPTTTVMHDIRHVLQLHGHEGASVLEPHETRLERAYRLVVPWMLSARYHDRPITCAPHPDHPDRLRLVFTIERVWRWWIALLDGSTDAATHEEVDGEMRNTWITPDGNIWLVHHTPLVSENRLQAFHEEDR